MAGSATVSHGSKAALSVGGGASSTPANPRAGQTVHINDQTFTVQPDGSLKLSSEGFLDKPLQGPINKAVGATGNAINAGIDSFKFLGNIWEIIGNGNFWWRVLFGAIGIACIIIGLTIVLHPSAAKIAPLAALAA